IYVEGQEQAGCQRPLSSGPAARVESRHPGAPGGRIYRRIRHGMPKTAGIILVGNEILSGKVEDANAVHLCRELRALGVEVRRITVIPDEVQLIADEVAT